MTHVGFERCAGFCAGAASQLLLLLASRLLLTAPRLPMPIFCQGDDEWSRGTIVALNYRDEQMAAGPMRGSKRGGHLCRSLGAVLLLLCCRCSAAAGSSPAWHAGMVAPYQIRLDEDDGLIWAPMDMYYRGDIPNPTERRGLRLRLQHARAL